MSADDAASLTRRSAIGLTGAALGLPAATFGQSSGLEPGNDGGPLSVRSFGARGDSDDNGVSGTDDTAAIQSAIDHLRNIGGGTLYFPEGRYKVSSFLTLCPNLRIVGAGQKAAWLVTAMGGGAAGTGEGLRNGSVFFSDWPSNRSNPAHIAIEHIGFHCSNGANVGAAFYDNCGTSIQIRNCVAYGFKYGLVFDQSELVDVSECDLSPADVDGACIWLVDGPTLRPGNEGGFTNRVSVRSCQINAGPRTYGILDDGGNCHSFVDNNYNGCLHHIRAAGVLGLKISGGEFESAAASPVHLDNKALDGQSVGSCDQVHFDTPTIIPARGQPCISVASAGTVVMTAPFFGNSTAAKVTGTRGIYALYSTGARNAGGGPTFDREAQNHWEVGNSGGGVIVHRTNIKSPP